MITVWVVLYVIMGIRALIVVVLTRCCRFIIRCQDGDTLRTSIAGLFLKKKKKNTFILGSPDACSDVYSGYGMCVFVR